MVVVVADDEFEFEAVPAGVLVFVVVAAVVFGFGCCTMLRDGVSVVAWQSGVRFSVSDDTSGTGMIRVGSVAEWVR